MIARSHNSYFGCCCCCSSTTSSSISLTSNLLLTAPAGPVPPIPLAVFEFELLRRRGLDVVMCSCSIKSSISSPSRPLPGVSHRPYKPRKQEHISGKRGELESLPIAFSSAVFLGFVRRSRTVLISMCIAEGWCGLHTFQCRDLSCLL